MNLPYSRKNDGIKFKNHGLHIAFNWSFIMEEQAD
jgi:hypothetical protein